MARQGLSAHAGAGEVGLPPDFRWPDNKRVAVFFRVACEGWSDGAWPALGPMGNPLKAGVPDLNALGWVEYGMRRGMERILKVLDRQQIKATMLICAVLAERYPGVVKDIADAGHAIAAHSYGMDVIPAYLDEAAERANIRRTSDIFESLLGRRPLGWISPRATPSPHTARLLSEAGYLWHGDTMNDDLPYKVEFGQSSLFAFPGGMELNDTPLSIRYGNSPRMMHDIFDDWLDFVRTHEEGACRISPSIHAHVFGRQTGIKVFEELIEKAKAQPDIWIGTQDEAISHIRQFI
ncbi:MAG: polysaccharide deacetylase family protein [Pigmentiphaga sp.]